MRPDRTGGQRVRYEPCAAWKRATRSAGIRPRAATSIPCDRAHSRTCCVLGAAPVAAAARARPRPDDEPALTLRPDSTYGASTLRSAFALRLLRSMV